MHVVIIAIVFAYFIVYRTGENVVWAIKGKDGDPPSFRRWQERQKRRTARAGGPITDRQEGRKFWAHLWHDAHASAHEWRQRRHGRRREERRKRWQVEDIERQKQQPLAPCAFCGAGQGEACTPDCPEVEAHDTNRAIDGRATVPPQRPATEPSPGAEPSHDEPTEPAEPSHADGTVPSAAEPTEPRRSHPPTPDRATPNRATADPATEPRDHAKDGNEAIRKFTEDLLAAKEEQLRTARKTVEENRDEFTPADIREHEKNCDQLERQIAELRFMAGRNRNNNVTPITKNQPPANVHAANHSTNGGNVTAPTVTGEIAGYEQILAEWDQTIAHLQEIHARHDEEVAAFEAQDAAYENRINGLRAANADEETIGTVVAAREANETQISAAKAALEASSVHLENAITARTRWVEGQGAMKETADATGAEGDRILRS
jgi:hypothetical protein